MSALPTSAILLETQPGTFHLGTGPFTRAPTRDRTRPAFYLPDFFLDDPAPWWHPATMAVLDDAGVAALCAGGVRPTVAWTDPSRAEYATAFADVHDAIIAGRLTKAVPIVLEHGRWDPGPAHIAALLERVTAAKATGMRYAWWHQDGGMIGASPELLFRITDGMIETQAVAGTAPADESSRLLADPKEAAEHQSVVDDLATALAGFGSVDADARVLMTLPQLAHLRTDLRATAAHPPAFEDLIAALHPTAALGVAPRSAGLGLLRALVTASTRGRFGAPFGIAWPDGAAVCVVAIRNVQWSGVDMALGAGGGVVAQSRVDREWDEITLKRDAVRRMLGL